MIYRSSLKLFALKKYRELRAFKLYCGKNKRRKFASSVKMNSILMRVNFRNIFQGDPTVLFMLSSAFLQNFG